MITELNEASFEQAISTDTPVLVDFWAGWCMPCKMLAPVVEALADEMDGQVDFGKVDIDQCPQLAAQYNITSIPTLVLFQNGKVINTLIGVRPKEQIREALENALSAKA